MVYITLFGTHKACQEWPCFGKIQFGEKTPKRVGLVCKTVGGFVIVGVLTFISCQSRSSDYGKTVGFLICKLPQNDSPSPNESHKPH